jgi:hypothetical protein
MDSTSSNQQNNRTPVFGHYGKANVDRADAFGFGWNRTGLANDGALRQVLHDYFAWATTTTMSR